MLFFSVSNMYCLGCTPNKYGHTSISFLEHYVMVISKYGSIYPNLILLMSLLDRSPDVCQWSLSALIDRTRAPCAAWHHVANGQNDQEI